MDLDNSEQYGPEWVFGNLWKARNENRLKVPLLETVVFKAGVPLRWLFANRAGDVCKKRALQKSDVVASFMAAAMESSGGELAPDQPRRICTARYRGGRSVVMDSNGFSQFFSVWPPARGEVELLALQPYVHSKGGTGTVYRNEYNIINDKGKTAFATYKVRGLDDETPPHEGNYVVGPPAKPFVRSLATDLNKLLEANTYLVVRFLEQHCSVRVLHLACEFVIDDDEELHLVWCDNVKVVTGDAASDLRLTSASNAPLEERRRRVAATSPKAARSPKAGASAPVDTWAASFAEQQTEQLLSKQLANASDVIENRAHSPAGAGAGKKKDAASTGRRESRQFTIKPAPASPAKKQQQQQQQHLPPAAHPHKCSGDFCSFVVSDPKSLEPGKGGNVFSEAEWNTLAGQLQVTEDSGDASSMRMLSFKSIALARDEQRGVSEAERQRSRQENKGRFAFGAAGAGAGADDDDGSGSSGDESRPPGSRGASRRNRLLKGTKSHELRRKWAQQRGEVQGGAQRYYQMVRVCRNCFTMYTTLDRARGLLQRDAPVAMQDTALDKMEQELQDWDNRVDALAAQLSGVDTPMRRQERARKQRQARQQQLRQRQRQQARAPPQEGQLSASLSAPSLPAVADAESPPPPEREEGESQQAYHDRITWKSSPAENRSHAYQHAREANRVERQRLRQRGTDFETLDGYLRGRSRTPHLSKSKPAPKTSGAVNRRAAADDKRHRGQVLVATSDEDAASRAVTILEEAGFDVQTASDGNEALARIEQHPFDALLVSHDLPIVTGLQMTKLIRQRETRRQQQVEQLQAAAATAAKDVPEVKRLPIIAYTSCAAPEDLRQYMEGGLDGCVSIPVDQLSLLNTVKAAVPNHDPKQPAIKTRVAGIIHKTDLGSLGVSAKGAHPMLSTTQSRARSLQRPAMGRSTELDALMRAQTADVLQAATVHELHLDAHTTIPYCVMGSDTADSDYNLINFVVCSDLYDTMERFQIFFQPIVARYPGCRILLWNCPGQAFTSWNPHNTLNNEFMAACLDALLRHAGGNNEFPTDRPFYMVGFGNGASVATFHATHYAHPCMRSLVCINGFAHVDPHLAGVLHDSMNVFSCSPATRPDLPVYFFTRFLFSAEYLSSVSVPLALNLYTAVHNPISLEGRIALANGALNNVDLRSALSELGSPLILVHSTRNGLVPPLHVRSYVDGRGAPEQRSIHQCLQQRASCVVWLESGHEVMQEQKKALCSLFEQLTTGYHELHDVAYIPISHKQAPHPQDDTLGGSTTATKRSSSGAVMGSASPPAKGYFEDHFVDNILGTLGEIQRMESSNTKTLSGTQRLAATDPEFASGVWGAESPQSSPTARRNNNRGATSRAVRQVGDFGEATDAWEQHRSATASVPKRANLVPGSPTAQQRRTTAGRHKMAQTLGLRTVLDPAAPAFERQDNLVYGFGSGSRIYPHPYQMPEVREYMGWRLKRNQKRLHRLELAARVLQRAFRGYAARQLIKRLRRDRAVKLIQRNWRAKMGRNRYAQRQREEWAVRLLQRFWRGRMGRARYLMLNKQEKAAMHIQRMWRGRMAVAMVRKLKERRERGAILLQTAWRGREARRNAFARAHERNAALIIQRVYRGHLGRLRAQNEREKFLFSKSQSQGIEFGRQMLLEHKLHGTRLQSEVTLLTQEKTAAEEEVEKLLEEISEFEEGVRQLEAEMHSLSKVEVEAAGVLDEESRVELRDQKMRLDSEFGSMLSKIAERKERLQGLERKLQALDQARQTKEEELRELERKLVVLLEEQQNELERIRRRQQKKGELLWTEDDDAPDGASGGEMVAHGGHGGHGGRGHGRAVSTGPTPQEKAEAAQLMQSTETLMKFGFMSMSMTMFSSMNMIRAMRRVAAHDTVMAAATANAHEAAAATAAAAMTGGASGGGGGGGGGSNSMPTGSELDKLKPSLKPGQMPGQEAVTVAAWTVDDVCQWLDTLSLGQYREAFADAAIDGAFLYDLNDEDLQNTLGIEHNLHRKKILNSIKRLKRAESTLQRRMRITDGGPGTSTAGSSRPGTVGAGEFGGGGGGGGGGAVGAPVSLAALGFDEADDEFDEEVVERQQQAPIRLADLIALCRHGKYKKLREALNPLPNHVFDDALVRVPFINGFGTAYQEAYEAEEFNLNKMDEHGNTLLIIASQNGHDKICKLLCSKGANANHQNKQGQTAAHFALAYQFFDLGAWLLDAEKGPGANDEVQNKFGMTPYDGLQ